MTLETLAGINTIDGFAVCHRMANEVVCVANPDHYVDVNSHENSVKFFIQNGPIEEKGINGCQVDTMVETALLIIQGLNKKFPCRENSLAITKLQEALHWLRERKADRVKRGVEGHNKT